MLSGDDAANLIEPLIAGMVEDPPWSTFILRLRRRVGADYASLTFRPLRDGAPHNRVVHLASGRQSPPIIAQLYRDSLYKSDPLPYHDMADGRVYALAELLREGDPRHDAYRAQLLSPSGMNVLRIMRVVEASGVGAWLTLSRRKREFAPEDDALMAALAPYLRAALASYVALERERMTASVANEAVRRMNFGWLTLDAEGRILDVDAHGQALLADGTVLTRGRGDKLAARDAAVGRDIAAALKALGADRQSRPRAIVLSREPWLDMLLVKAAKVAAGATRPAPTLVAYVHSDQWSSADRCEQLGQLFDLTPRQAGLALALSRGMSIAEAAAELGLSVESARTYSKRIYAKTGARGQADLVRFVHRSVLAIA
ncbi:helix-turn-helix transcriptional regulator [Caulobacter soli]|uniref:helix-turn-helix transcriptional regulator n=1 Tax=Caulobacter soli TaxID=2708539 RepID=UPI00196A7434|nr:helix-turn-helix transcriptional regulator [Caulobacter soli]